MYFTERAVTSPFGPRVGGFHNGVDYGLPYGTPIPAIEGGVVKTAGPSPTLSYPDGTMRPDIGCIIQHEGGYIVYAHQSRVNVLVGQRVERGQIIGFVGNSGYVLPKPTGPDDHVSGTHLHIEEHSGTYKKSLSDGPVKDITPRLRAYQSQEEEVTQADHDKAMNELRAENARIIVRTLADVLEGKPNYEEQQPAAFKGHVDRLLDADQPLEERRLLRDFLANNDWHQGDHSSLSDKESLELKAKDIILGAEDTKREAEEMLEILNAA